MNIGKKDVLWGYLSLILVQGINVILLPFVLYYLSVNELGLWYTFTSLYSLAMLIDFGFQATLTRHISYVWSGAKEIKKTGYTIVEQLGEWNNEFFLKLTGTIKFIYYSMGIIITFLLLPIGTTYIYIVSVEVLDITTVMLAWSFYMTAIILNIAFSFWNSFLKGIGAIKLYNQTLIITKIVQLILSVIFLLLGYGILGVSLAYLISVIINRLIQSAAFYNFNNKTKEMKKKIILKADKDLFFKLLPNTLKTGIVSLSNYLVINFPIILSSYFISLEISGEFGLTNQIITLIITISNSYFNTYLSKFNYLRVKNNNNSLVKLFRRAVSINYLINLILFMLLILFGELILSFISTNNSILATSLLVIIVSYRFLYNNQVLFVSLLSTKNIIPYYKSFLISAITIVFIQVILLNVYNNLLSIIIPILLIQIIFNNWYWPYKVLKDLRSV